MHTHTVTGRRLHPELGLEVSNLDLRDALPEYLWEGLRQALWEHSLLVFRRQPLSASDLVKVARPFGTDHSSPKRFETVGPSPDQQWHAVGSIDGSPALATLLTPRELPREGGGMEFTSTRALYASFASDDRAALDRATATHVFRADPQRAISWPLVLDHPHNHRRSLLIGYHVVGTTPVPAHLAPAVLMEPATRAPHVYRHDFDPGDVLLWDNWSLMHRACSVAPGERRVIEEIAIS